MNELVSQNPEDLLEEISYDFIGLARNLRTFFTSVNGPKNKKVVAGGTAPMRSNSEIPFILFASDFQELTLIDPGYAEQNRLGYDLDFITSIDPNAEIKHQEDSEETIVTFRYDNQERKVTFKRSPKADLMKKDYYPEDFNTYFSGRRVAPNTETVQNGVSAFNIDHFLDLLPDKSYFLPDRGKVFEENFGSDSVESLKLQEVPDTKNIYEEYNITYVDENNNVLDELNVDDSMEIISIRRNILLDIVKNKLKVKEWNLDLSQSEFRLTQENPQGEIIITNETTLRDLIGSDIEDPVSRIKSINEGGLLYKNSLGEIQSYQITDSDYHREMLSELDYRIRERFGTTISNETVALYRKVGDPLPEAA